MEKDIRPILDKLLSHLRSGRLVFFVGAGISKAGPACLPLGSELKYWTLQSLCREDEVGILPPILARLQCGKGSLDDVASKFERMMLELVYQCIHELPRTRGEDAALQALKVVDTQFRCDPFERSPNLNHRILATLLGNGHIPIVITTNFDHLIEDAFAVLKQEDQGRKLVRFWLDTHFAGFNLSSISGQPLLMKLHGTIEDGSPVGLLSQVARGLHPDKENALLQVLKQYPVCFAGYGGGDIDIRRVLAIGTTQDIFWLVRNDLGYRAKERQLARLFTTEQLHLLPYDLNDLFELIGKQLSLMQPASLSDNRIKKLVNYSGFFERWSRSIEPHEKYYVIGRVFQEIAERRYELAYYLKASELAPRGWAKGATRFKVGTAYLGLGAYEKSLEHLRLARRYARRIKDISTTAAALRDSGDCIYRVAMDEDGTERRLLLSRALWYYSCAINLLETCSNASEDTRNQIAYVFSLKAIVYRELGRFRRSLEYFAYAYKTAKEFGHYWLQAQVLVHRAATMARAGLYSEALLESLMALRIFDILGNAAGKAVALRRIAEVNWRAAHHLYEGLGGGEAPRRFSSILQLLSPQNMEQKANVSRIFFGYWVAAKNGGYEVFVPSLHSSSVRVSSEREIAGVVQKLAEVESVTVRHIELVGHFLISLVMDKR